MQNGGKAMSYLNTHMVSMGKSYSYGVITSPFPMPMTCAGDQGSQTVFKSCTFAPEILQNVDI